jgi:rubredoxin
MSERALRGSRLGAASYENDRDIELAPRQAVSYDCPNGHRFEVPFSAEADEIPAKWECRVCGAPAQRADATPPEEARGKPARTHWDMLLERRTREELEEILAERLAVLRAGGIKTGPTSKKSA